MKKVLFTVHKFFPEHRAGTEVLTLKVAQELQRRGYQVAVLTANPPDTDARRKENSSVGPELSIYDYEGICVYSLNEEARLKDNRFSNEHYHPYLKKHYQQIFDSFAPGMVHCFHLQNLSASLIEEATIRNIPIIYSATDFWLICPIVQLRRPDGSNCNGPAPAAVNCLTCYTPKLLPVKSELLTAFADKYAKSWHQINSLPQSLNRLATEAIYSTYVAKKLPAAIKATMERPAILKYFANKLSAITVPTKLMQELFLSNGLDPELIHHIPYGIDSEPLKKGQDKRPSNELRIAFIGTLFEHKGPDLLIKAFLQLPPQSKASLQIFGDQDQFPEYSNYLRELASNNSALSKKITFAGTFPNTQIGEIFRNIDVLVVPSRWYENTPLVIQSALAAKTPVVATNLGGMSELIKHETNGLLFEPDNYQSLHDQLFRLLEDKSLLGRLINNIVPQNTVSEMVDQLESIYVEIKK